jgi:putative oxidoreductase
MLNQLHNSPYALLIGRILLAFIYFKGGLSLATGTVPVEFAATKGIPGLLVWLGFIIKLLAGLAIIVGYQTRIAALALIGFTLLTAFIFHGDFGNVFWKEVSMIGGLLVLAAAGPGDLSIDARSQGPSSEN